MKFDIKYISGIALLPLLTACADYIDTNNFAVEQPASQKEYLYLNDYKPLKEYVDRAAHPMFTLGCGVNAQEYLKGTGVYLLTNSNFDMVTTGNAMKYASVVADNGEMNFSTVRDFVSAATQAGLQVYGHTLCWHSQQNVKWLNSLIADKEIEFDPDQRNEVVDYEVNFADVDEYSLWHQSPDGNGTVFSINKEEGCLQVDNPAAVNFWEVQYFTFDNVTLVKGEKYKMEVTLRATSEGAVQGNVGGWSDNAGIRIAYSTDWETKTVEFTAANDGNSHGLFQTGDLAGTIQYKSIRISHTEAPSMEVGVSLIANGDADNGESSSLIARDGMGGGDAPAAVVDDPAGTGKVFACNYKANPANDYDSQLFITSSEPLEAGTKIHVKFRYRATDNRSISTQAHGAPGSYHHWQFIGTLNATTEWTEHEFTGEISSDQAGSDGCSTIALNLCGAADAGTFYIDDVVFEKLVAGNTQPLTPAEKAEILTAEMERWVKGMMEATEGKVKAWDVVNEAVSGHGGSRYDLQHASDGGATDFYWQDYLGDNFARIPIRFARKYFAENGGNPDELKLFINDYNLESDWDDNKKLKSLISWIEQWESDGETKIDGIGSQMHISYYMNPETQKKKEEHIVKMLELMANTKKLVRLTELDMAICDENGNQINTADVTFEQHKLMGDFYKWIVEKYFEIIPVDQQFGICAWAQTDSPEGSGWRPNNPIGLWTLDYSRKPAYAGFADGLQGK